MNDLSGKEFGNYRLVREIARGSYGVVYQAQHTILTDRLVAIKVLHELLLTSTQERDTFVQEAQFLERLKHPFILPLLDVGIQQNIPFFVTEYAASGSLRMRLQTQSPQLLSFEETLTILSQIGEALQYAHQQNIIHRDLKPDNILFHANGDAMLADFGVATILSTGSIRHTSTTGTPAYMAPEQFRGQVSKETDQYALGCLAYELFTGRQPFAAPDFIAMGFKHATENPIPPRQINPSIPVSIEQAILKAMAKERDQRYPDVRAFITALQPQSATISPSASQMQSTHLPGMPGPKPAQPFTGTASVSNRKASTTLQLQKQFQVPPLNAMMPASSLNPTTEKILAAISYLTFVIPTLLLPIWVMYCPIVLLIIYLIGKKSRIVRFHLAQSIFFVLITLIFIILSLILSNITPVASFLYIASIAFYIIVYCIWTVLAYRGKNTKFPLIGNIAEKFANRIDKGNLPSVHFTSHP